MYVDGSMIYYDGPCEDLDPWTDGDLHELVGMDPPDDLADFGSVCR